MPSLERTLGALVASNNERIRAIDAGAPNPRAVEDLAWHRRLVAAHPDIRAEWDAFVAGGGRLPLIEDVISEHQGNEGAWRAGLLVSRGRPRDPLAAAFPVTVRALRGIPGLRSALWSHLDSGTLLPEHTGPNAGVLRYHLGVRCGSGSGLEVAGVEVPYEDGRGILFDDTVPHSAWNRGDTPRVTLFCEIERPLPRRAAVLNRLVQGVISLDPRYRRAPARAAQLHLALNGTGERP